MKYARILALGEARVQMINNMLSQDKSMYFIARMIQKDWKAFDDVAEKTLVQQLNRYKAELKLPTVHVVPKGTPGMGKLDRVVTISLGKVDVISRLHHLERMLLSRIEGAINKEKGLGGVLMKQLTTEITEYRTLLLDIQKVQFDLGLDEYKSPLAQGRFLSQRKVGPDGTITETSASEVMLSAIEAANQALSSLTETADGNP